MHIIHTAVHMQSKTKMDAHQARKRKYINTYMSHGAITSRIIYNDLYDMHKCVLRLENEYRYIIYMIDIYEYKQIYKYKNTNTGMIIVGQYTTLTLI